MYDQVLENLNKATESAIQIQQEMFRNWTNFWPTAPTSPSNWTDQIKGFQKKWAETYTDLMKKQRQMLETQFNGGLKGIEEAFKMTSARNPEELRTKMIEYWQKSFECLRQLAESQMQAFQSALAKWTELAAKTAS